MFNSHKTNKIRAWEFQSYVLHNRLCVFAVKYLAKVDTGLGCELLRRTALGSVGCFDIYQRWSRVWREREPAVCCLYTYSAGSEKPVDWFERQNLCETVYGTPGRWILRESIYKGRIWLWEAHYPCFVKNFWIFISANFLWKSVKGGFISLWNYLD